MSGVPSRIASTKFCMSTAWALEVVSKGMSMFQTSGLAKPLFAVGEPPPMAEDRGPRDVLDIHDVLGKRSVETGLLGRVSIPEDHASAALEVMSR